jgi:Sec7-like guanine-nucleotide exchange factor
MPSKSLVSQNQSDKTSLSEVNNVHIQSMEYDLEISQHENSMRFNATEFIDDELSQLMPFSKIDKWSCNEND